MRTHIIGVLVVLAIIAFFALITGVLVLRSSLGDAAAGPATPHEIRLADLIAHGPGQSRHLTVTDFHTRPDYVILTGKNHNEAYFLLQPEGADPAVKSKLLLVVVTHGDVATRHAAYAARDRFTGIYEDTILWGTIGYDGQRLLKEKYADVALDQMPHLQVRPYTGERTMIGVWIASVSGAVLTACVVAAMCLMKFGRQPPAATRSP